MKEVEKQDTQDVAGGNDIGIRPGGTPPYVPAPGLPADPFPAPLTELPQ